MPIISRTGNLSYHKIQNHLRPMKTANILFGKKVPLIKKINTNFNINFLTPKGLPASFLIRNLTKLSGMERENLHLEKQFAKNHEENDNRDNNKDSHERENNNTTESPVESTKTKIVMVSYLLFMGILGLAIQELLKYEQWLEDNQLSNVPPKDKFFIRTQASAIAESIYSELPQAFPNIDIKIMLIGGIPGSGKTQIVSSILQKQPSLSLPFSREIQGLNLPIHWSFYRSAGTQDFTQSYTALAKHLGIINPSLLIDETKELYISRIRVEIGKALTKYPDSVFVFEDADDFQSIEPYLPKNSDIRYKVIITTTNSYKNFFTDKNIKYGHIDIGTGMSFSESADLLRKLTGLPLDQYGEKLIKQLDNRPLYISIAGRTIKEQRLTYETYLQNLFTESSKNDSSKEDAAITLADKRVSAPVTESGITDMLDRKVTAITGMEVHKTSEDSRIRAMEQTVKEQFHEHYYQTSLADIKAYVASKHKPVTCFLSYSWSIPELEQPVHRLAEELRAAGVNVKLDIENNYPSTRISAFTEEIKDADVVIVMGTSMLQTKWKSKVSVVEMELGQIFEKTKSKGLVIPVLLEGSKETSFPNYLIDHVFIDRRSSSNSKHSTFEILKTIFREDKAVIAGIEEDYYKDLAMALEDKEMIRKQAEEKLELDDKLLLARKERVRHRAANMNHAQKAELHRIHSLPNNNSVFEDLRRNLSEDSSLSKKDNNNQQETSGTEMKL